MAKRLIKKPQNQKRPDKSQPKKKEQAKKSVQIEERVFDASDKILGRLATQVANSLRGKDKPSFVPNALMGDKVKVINAGKIVITGNKLNQKEYIRHTGYLGHLKKISLKELMAKNPAEVLRRAVFGMLPKNKLRARWLKNLKITN